MWQSTMQQGQQTRKTKDRNQQGPNEKAKIFLQILPLNLTRLFFLHKLFRVEGGRGPMECGKVRCVTDREHARPEIETSKAPTKKRRYFYRYFPLHVVVLRRLR